MGLPQEKEEENNGTSSINLSSLAIYLKKTLTYTYS